MLNFTKAKRHWALHHYSLEAVATGLLAHRALMEELLAGLGKSSLAHRGLSQALLGDPANGLSKSAGVAWVDPSINPVMGCHWCEGGPSWRYLFGWDRSLKSRGEVSHG